jgi:hypothetical protein
MGTSLKNEQRFGLSMARNGGGAWRTDVIRNGWKWQLAPVI